MRRAVVFFPKLWREPWGGGDYYLMTCGGRLIDDVSRDPHLPKTRSKFPTLLRAYLQHDVDIVLSLCILFLSIFLIYMRVYTLTGPMRRYELKNRYPKVRSFAPSSQAVAPIFTAESLHLHTHRSFSNSEGSSFQVKV
jgi:hypothetical protein